MEHLKVCFVGIGSIGKRHIRNLRLLCNDRNIHLHIDAYRRTLDPVEGVNCIYTNIEDIPEDYDVIFITNPTEMHMDSLRRLHNKGRNFFIEKPVVSIGQLEDAKKFQIRKNVVYYVACPLRYNAVIQWIKKNVDSNDVISVRSISSSYLPDWRPGQDYRKTYSAHKNMGGGVSIDLIHEWDYITYLFGWPQNVHSFIKKKSNLEIDSDDIAVYIAEYPNKIIELHLDYFGRKTIREIQLFTNKDTIIGDIVNNEIRFLVKGETINFHEKRDDYQKRELDYFLDMIYNNLPVENGYYHSLEVLGITQR